MIPSAVKYQLDLATSIGKTEKVLGAGADLSAQKGSLKRITELINGIHTSIGVAQGEAGQEAAHEDHQKLAEFYCTEIKPGMDEIRKQVDELEALIADDLWPMPKFWEMLFVN